MSKENDFSQLVGKTIESVQEYGCNSVGIKTTDGEYWLIETEYVMNNLYGMTITKSSLEGVKKT